jgi:hypothetical protein
MTISTSAPTQVSKASVPGKRRSSQKGKKLRRTPSKTQNANPSLEGAATPSSTRPGATSSSRNVAPTPGSVQQTGCPDYAADADPRETTPRAGVGMTVISGIGVGGAASAGNLEISKACALCGVAPGFHLCILLVRVEHVYLYINLFCAVLCVLYAAHWNAHSIFRLSSSNDSALIN